MRGRLKKVNFLRKVHQRENPGYIYAYDFGIRVLSARRSFSMCLGQCDDGSVDCRYVRREVSNIPIYDRGTSTLTVV